MTDEKASVRQRVYEVIDDSTLSLEEKQRRALAIGRDYLGVENANIQRQARDGEAEDTVVISVGGPELMLPEGAKLDPQTTYCRRTVRNESSIALSDAPEQGWADDPAYQKHQFDCYLGTTIFASDGVYGTLCFISRTSRERDFTVEEKAFVELLARLLGRQIEANEYESRLENSNQTIQQVTDKYEAILRLTPEAIFLADASTGEIAEVNTQATVLTGYTESTLREMSVSELVPSQQRDEYTKLFFHGPEEISTETLPDGTQARFERADGSTIPVEIASNSVEIGDQQYRLAIIRDITTRRQRIKELERNRDFLRQIQEAVNLGGWEGRLDTESGTWSDEVYRILGLPQDTEPTAEAAFECFHPEDRPIIEEAFTALTTNGTPYDLELRLKPDGGTTQWVRTRGQPQYDDDTGELVAVRGVIQDITDDKQREQDLSLQKSAIKQAPVGVTISDATHPDNPIIYANDGFEKLTGYAKAQAMGQNCRFLQGERTSEETRAEIRQAVEAEEFIQTTILNYRSNQTPFWNQLTISPVTGENTDEVTHFIGIQEDVTAQERRERLIEVLNRVLRHNLRNSMTVIRGHAVEIAERTDGELARMAEKIKQQSDQLIELSEKAIAFEKTVDDSDLFAARDICADVEAVADTLRKKYPDSEIRVELAGDGQVMALERVRVALKELGENAITHGSDPVTFRVETADDGGVMVQVEDAGEGLPRNERVVLQEGQEEPLVHGSSIGLWTVNWIVTGMGGEVSTAVDGGTTVTLSFPPVSGEELPASATDRRTPLNFD